MRKISLIGFVMLIVSIPTFAGGLLTNTNQHVAFLRMLARGASIDIDGVYSNPAGLAFLPGDGLYLSLNGQSAYQTRNIDMTFPLFPEDGHRRYYEGKASAPFVPLDKKRCDEPPCDECADVRHDHSAQKPSKYLNFFFHCVYTSF